jgi:hypothetical protein
MCANTDYIILNHMICLITTPWHIARVSFLHDDFVLAHKAGYYYAHREIVKYIHQIINYACCSYHNLHP